MAVTLAEQLMAILGQMQSRQPEIAAALEYTQGTHTFDDLVAMVMSGRLRWWGLPSTFMLTEVIEYPRTRHYNVFLAGGNLDEIYEAHEGLIEAAKLAGCTSITLGGRRGWVKALKHLGWKEAHTFALLDISTEPTHEQGRQQDPDHEGRNRPRAEEAGPTKH